MFLGFSVKQWGSFGNVVSGSVISLPISATPGVAYADVSLSGFYGYAAKSVTAYSTQISSVSIKAQRAARLVFDVSDMIGASVAYA